MIIEQIYTGCLAQGAYYVQSGNEALVIDPLREVDQYLQRAEKGNAKIKWVLETHFHADFVSGHLDLAKKSGARIVYGPLAKPSFEHYPAKDGEELTLGDVRIKVLHTPGHTMESTCYLLINENGNEVALFSGDTLFIGDVGRPDLAQKLDDELTTDKLAGYLFDSLRNKIMPLADEIIVYPAHGAGSACGKNMSNETTDTLGHQKNTNYALRADMTRAEFIREVTTGLEKPPGYFPLNVLMNIRGYESIDRVLERGTHALGPDAFEAAANETGALVLDTRAPHVFAHGFIPNAINIGIDGSFAPWVGTLITDIKHPILFVAESGREQEVVTRLARVGYDNTIGFLEGGFAEWKAAGKEVDQIDTVSADELAALQQTSPVRIIDVRKVSEYAGGHLPGADLMPLDTVNDHLSSIPKEGIAYVHCAGGYRSMIFLSILRARGYRNLVDVDGGFKKIRESGKFRIEEGSPITHNP